MKYKLTINVSIADENNYNSALQVREEIIIKADSFMEMCKILGNFHDLAKTVRGDQK